MNLNKNHLIQTSHYFTGNVLSHVLGFLTFPLLTRILLISEYGLIGLVTNTIRIALGVTNLGLQQSSIRYYEDFKSNKNQDMPIYYSTFIISSFFFGLGGFFVLLILTQTILNNIVDAHLLNLLSFMAISVLMGCLSNSLTSFLRAEQKSKFLNIINLMSKITSIGLSFFFLFFIIEGLYGFFFGIMLSQFIIVFILIKRILDEQSIGWKYFSKSFLKRALIYGLPLSLLEVCHSLLNFGDRYVIQYFLGLEAVGLYTGAYTLAMQIVQVIDYPVLSVVPVIYFEYWTKKGREAVQTFLRESLCLYCMVAIPIIFGVIGVAEELILIMASAKYVTAATIISYVVIGGFIFASSTFFSSGLYIYKKSHIPAIVMLIATFVNLGLNYYLVPKYGILGAAIATLIGYSSYVAIIIPLAFKYISYKPDWKSIGKFLVYSIIMFIAICKIDVGAALANLLIRTFLGFSLYSLMLFIFEKRIRQLVKNLINNRSTML